MKKAVQVLAILVIVIFASTSLYAGGSSLTGSQTSPQPSAPLRKALSVLADANSQKALGLAQKYYTLAMSKATAHEKAYLPTVLPWKPDFTGKHPDPAKAMQYMNYSAFLTSYTDLKGIYLSLSASLLALDPGNAAIAGNLASSIAAFSEDSTRKQLGSALKSSGDARASAEDAAAMYEYALSLRLAKPTIDIGAMPLLLNYGYLCIDLNRLDTARVVFETAVKLSPGYPPSSEGMAAYWIAKGDKAKAKKLLESANLSVMQKALKKMADGESTKKNPNVLTNDSPDVMESKLKNLAKIEPVLATDFYENLDPSGAAKARQLVRELQQSLKFKALDYSFLSQYSTLKNFYSDGGNSAYEAFANEFESMRDRAAEDQMSEEEGQELDNELDQLLNSGEMKQGIFKAAPEMAVFSLKSYNYVNPTDIAVQKYNVGQLKRKWNGYEIYLAKQIAEMQKAVMFEGEDLEKKVEPLEEAMEEELDQLSLEHEASHNSSGGCDTCVVKTHAIHQKYDSRLNNLVETTWMDGVNLVNSRYMQRVKPNIEAMYNECMKNILLISDPNVRAQTEKNLKKDVEGLLISALIQVDTAYKLDTHGYPYECNCNEQEVAAAAARQLEAQLADEAKAQVMENKARKAFEAGVINENSQLYQRLDKYSANLQLLFTTAKLHPLKTELTFEFKLPGTLKNDALSTDASASLKMTENHIRNTTSYSGSISANLKGSAKDGALSAAASVAVKGEMTVDAKGNLINADIAGTAQGTVTAGMFEANGGYEASVQRGCKFTGEVNKIYTDMLQTPEAVEIFQPQKTKQTLWKGEYQVSK